MRVGNKLTLQLKVHVPSGFLIRFISYLFPSKFFLVFNFFYISFNLLFCLILFFISLLSSLHPYYDLYFTY